METTAIERKAYMASLRNQWQAAKKTAENPEVKGLYQLLMAQSPEMRISMYSFAFVLSDMRRVGMDGLPYLDCKTFNSWKDCGFKVKKGEKSQIHGIVWKSFETQEKDNKGQNLEFLFPKAYALFHRSQVEAI